MYFPIKIKTTRDSFIIIHLSLPLFPMFRIGFKPDVIDEGEQITLMTGKEVSCLHLYVLALQIRIRSNCCMNCLKEDNPNTEIRRIIISKNKGWAQVFISALI